MKRTALAVIAAIGLATPAFAQELPTLAEVAATIDGREVRASGAIGYRASAGNDAVFVTLSPEGEVRAIYEVVFALDRAALASLDACQVRFIGGADTCTADISAEIDVDGSMIRLIVYEVRNLAPAS